MDMFDNGTYGRWEILAKGKVSGYLILGTTFSRTHLARFDPAP